MAVAAPKHLLQCVLLKRRECSLGPPPSQSLPSIKRRVDGNYSLFCRRRLIGFSTLPRYQKTRKKQPFSAAHSVSFILMVPAESVKKWDFRRRPVIPTASVLLWHSWLVFARRLRERAQQCDCSDCSDERLIAWSHSHAMLECGSKEILASFAAVETVHQ
jgi:hypothetical protein